MPDLEGALPLILLMVFLWVRGIAAAVKKNRQRQQGALEAGAAKAGPRTAPAAREAAAREAMSEGSAARRPTVREQLRDIGRQFEQQMQQAAEEGRPGSLVGHVDPEEAPETPVFLRPTRPGRPVPGRRPSPSPTAMAPPVPQSTRERRGAKARPIDTRPSRGVRIGSGGALERLDRYPPLAKAVILSEILGTPPGLSDREGSPTSRN